MQWISVWKTNPNHNNVWGKAEKAQESPQRQSRGAGPTAFIVGREFEALARFRDC